ncbi:MAG: GFA family protein, partial [Parvibaculum sp.]|nr:GFA family protein [Parvibaculum sp.]
SGNTVERQFCATCGSPIFSMLSANKAIAIIKAGTLDDTSDLQPASEVWCDSAQSWVPPLVAAARFPKNPA